MSIPETINTSFTPGGPGNTASSSSRDSMPELDPTKSSYLRDIFKQIGERVCKISVSGGSCSGILWGDGVVVAPAHAVEVNGVFEKDVDILYKSKRYVASQHRFHSVDDDSMYLDKCRYYDLCFFKIKDEDFPRLGPLPVSNHSESPDLCPGEEVYFATFQSEEKSPSFHKGHVSSVDDSHQTSLFSIDGTVLPGNSGSPVFHVKDRCLYLLGMIIAEQAIISSAFTKNKKNLLEKLEMLKPARKYAVQDTVRQAAANELLTNLVNTVFDNFATGIGKVIHAKHIYMLTIREGNPLPEEDSPFLVGLPVHKGERIPKGMTKTSLDWFHREYKGKRLHHAIYLEYGGKNWKRQHTNVHDEGPALHALYEYELAFASYIKIKKADDENLGSFDVLSALKAVDKLSRAYELVRKQKSNTLDSHLAQRRTEADGSSSADGSSLEAQPTEVQNCDFKWLDEKIEKWIVFLESWVVEPNKSLADNNYTIVHKHFIASLKYFVINGPSDYKNIIEKLFTLLEKLVNEEKDDYAREEFTPGWTKVLNLISSEDILKSYLPRIELLLKKISETDDYSDPEERGHLCYDQETCDAIRGLRSSQNFGDESSSFSGEDE